MKSGIELIAQERQEQIEKHGRTILKDVALNSAPVGPFNLLPLRLGATKLIGCVGGIPFPPDWNKEICEKMVAKADVQRLVIAGAFIAAEIDRLIMLNSDQNVQVSDTTDSK
jgi:hypothetical protein